MKNLSKSFVLINKYKIMVRSFMFVRDGPRKHIIFKSLCFEILTIITYRLRHPTNRFSRDISTICNTNKILDKYNS